MIRILCYGDSNTWGYVPNINGYSKNAKMSKYQEKDCWWFGLNKNSTLFVDGLCGRSIANENKWLKNRNATKTICDDLKKYKNLDLIVVQLGTNDCKSEYNNSSEQIADNLKLLLQKIKEITKAKIAIISPAPIEENNLLTQKYYVGAQQKSKQLDGLFKVLAQQNDYVFISGANLEVGEDGEHLTHLGHKQLKQRVEEAMKKEL